jgi:hypothetical protein
MLTRQKSVGFPFIRTRTGSGLRHPGLRVFASEELTSINGLMPRICMTASKTIAMSLKSQCEIGYLLQNRANDAAIDTEGCARDAGGLVGSEENHQVRNLFWSKKTMHNG